MKFTSAISAIAMVVFTQTVTVIPAAAASGPSIPTGAHLDFDLIETNTNKTLHFFTDLSSPRVLSSNFDMLDPGQEEVGIKSFNLTITDQDTGDVTTLLGTGNLQQAR